MRGLIEMLPPDVRFETDNLTEVIDKMEAYKLLFDTICLPTLLIGGHWLDDYDHSEFVSRQPGNFLE